MQKLQKPTRHAKSNPKSKSKTRRRTCPGDFNRREGFKVGAVLSRNNRAFSFRTAHTDLDRVFTFLETTQKRAKTRFSGTF